uniref:Uncharacterized protein n=1 Tax=Ciona intestinalis TaxID=7719 RepID=H2XPB5_CIOIN
MSHRVCTNLFFTLHGPPYYSQHKNVHLISDNNLYFYVLLMYFYVGTFYMRKVLLN